VGGEDAAEVGRERAGRVGVRLRVERVLEVPHAVGEAVALAAEVGVVGGEVVEEVLLAQGPQAHQEDARHEEQLHERMLVLGRVLQQPRRVPAPEAVAGDVRHLCLRGWTGLSPGGGGGGGGGGVDMGLGTRESYYRPTRRRQVTRRAATTIPARPTCKCSIFRGSASHARFWVLFFRLAHCLWPKHKPTRLSSHTAAPVQRT
jgi:hypothetical protein